MNPRYIIMVVDDDEAVRESIKFALELEGLTVIACGSGAELLAHPDLNLAGCLVLDYRMPDMDGFQVVDRLAEHQVKVPIILITSPVTESFRRRAKAVGVRVVLEKPLLNGALVKGIQEALGHIA